MVLGRNAGVSSDAMRPDLKKTTFDYAVALAAHGAKPAAVGWPSTADLVARYEAMLGPLQPIIGGTSKIRLLDLGCGPGLLVDYLTTNNLLSGIDYLGVD